MPRKRLLMACPNHWRSPFQVGSQHLARCFVRAGWEVAYLSDPISPLHLCRGLTADLKARLASYLAGGIEDLDGHLWSYVPAALLTPHNKPILRSDFIHRHWQRWTIPGVISRVRQRGFGQVDLLYIDSIEQSFWLDVLDYRQAVYRVADYNPHFEKYTPAAHALEQAMARRVDLVLYPSRNLQRYADELGARRTLCLENGVDFAHFSAGPLPPPPEYALLRGPIAVYLGVLPDWFHFDWLRQAALGLPEASFVLIGPPELARRRLGDLKNVHLLGLRPYAEVPAYLQHAQVGMIPFDIRLNPRGVEVLRPQKLFAYLASGIPVVSCEWDEIKRLAPPARLCATGDQFVEQLRQAIADPGDRPNYRRYAGQFDWAGRLTLLLEALSQLAVTGELPPSLARAG